MLVTICTIRQLPQAIALGDSFCQYATHPTDKPLVLIGLSDDPDHLPVGFVSPYPLLAVKELLNPMELTTLSSVYTPTEFASACKPLFIAEAFRRYPSEEKLLYADPNIQFTGPLAPIWEQLSTANTLLTPFVTEKLRDDHWPDEKFFQNIGLYSADFLAFRRSSETDRLLTWWDERVRERAYINFCEGLCLDQIWLMHVPVFFRDVRAIRNPGWHVALWNLHERTIRREGEEWLATGPDGQNQTIVFVNFKGLINPDEGFFPHQTRLQLLERSTVSTLVNDYRRMLKVDKASALNTVIPTFGQQPEPVVLRGWRHATVQSLRNITRFLDRMAIPAL